MDARGIKSVVPRLILVTDRHRSCLLPADLFPAAIAGGCDAIQVRDADLPKEERRALIVAAKRASNGAATVLVNNEIDLAQETGVGLHLPEHGLPPSVARLRLGPRILIGRSVHSAAAATDSTGANFLVAGSIFSTDSHPGRPPLGLSGLADIVAATDLPVLAIGGIELGRVSDVIASGAHGICVVGAIASAPDAQAAISQTRALRRILDDALGIRGEITSMPLKSEPTGEQTGVEIDLNGKRERFPTGTTIATFLAAKGLQDKLVVVEVNGQIVARSAFAGRIFENGDQVEVVHFVGGG